MSSTGNEGFILAEDAALRKKLINEVFLKINNESKQVPVWYRWPEGEKHQTNYPFITLDLIGVRYDPSRAHSAVTILDYEPSTSRPGDKFISEFPQPYLLTYQISTHSRAAVHDRLFLKQLINSNILPNRTATLDIPEDGTRRRIHTRDINNATYIDGKSKAVHRWVITVDVEAETLPSKVDKFNQVNEVKFTHILSIEAPALIPIY